MTFSTNNTQNNDIKYDSIEYCYAECRLLIFLQNDIFLSVVMLNFIFIMQSALIIFQLKSNLRVQVAGRLEWCNVLDILITWAIAYKIITFTVFLSHLAKSAVSFHRNSWGQCY
jgi:hypothetical protein